MPIETQMKAAPTLSIGDELISQLVKHLNSIDQNIRSQGVQFNQFQSWLRRLLADRPGIAERMAQNKAMQKLLEEKGNEEHAV